MATEFLMPKLGLTMEAGTITEWLVADGDQVAVGAPILTIETDKTETEVEATAAGRIHLVGAVGETYDCGTLIGWVLADGEEPSAAPAPAAAARPAAGAAPAPAAAAAPATMVPAGGRLFASPNARRIAAERGVDLRTVRGTGPNERIVSEDLERVVATPAPAPHHAPPATIPPAGGIVPATAAARQLADLLGVDIATVPPDPIERRATRESVAIHVRGLIAAAHSPTPVPAAQPGPQTLPALQEPTKVVTLSGIRGTIAKRMHESLSQMAQLTLFMDADLDAVAADRAARQANGTAPGYTDYIIAAAARALLDHPIVNSQITDAGIALLPEVHVGMAVAIDGGLVVPVITDTAGRDFASLSAETARLAAAARDGSLRFDELEGGTFSVSTLGMFGVDGFTPVINPPNASILGVGRLRDDVVVDDEGAVSTVKRLTLSLTWDHRVLDGAPAAEFCRAIADYLQQPADLDQPRQ